MELEFNPSSLKELNVTEGVLAWGRVVISDTVDHWMVRRELNVTEFVSDLLKSGHRRYIQSIFLRCKAGATLS